MNYWKIILATMVIFGMGVVTGGLLVQHGPRLRPNRAAHVSSVGRPSVAVPPGALKLDLLRRMQKELDLTPDQHERVDRIINQSQDRTRKLMEPLRPQVMEELKRAREQFREVLTPPQQARFDELLRQQQHQHDQRHPQPGRERPAEGTSGGTNAPSPANP